MRYSANFKNNSIKMQSNTKKKENLHERKGKERGRRRSDLRKNRQQKKNGRDVFKKLLMKGIESVRILI